MEGRGEVQFAGPQGAERVGIGVVHQELPLLPNLTAAENMVLGQQSGGFLSGRKRRKVEAEYGRRAEMFPGAPPADALLGRVGLHGWQMTAIIRARYLGSRVVILDEPTSSLDAGERRLLHGNQQKVLIGRWLQSKPKALILYEPTRGVDVGARGEIHRLIRGLAQAGAAVMVVSSEPDELPDLCDRVLVMVERATRALRIVDLLAIAKAQSLSLSWPL
jgi:ABC-type sugar transport system ATPase subunit